MCDIEVKPLKSLTELLAWNGLTKGEEEAIGNLSLFSISSLKTKDHPKTIICHDMKGGYLQDRFCNGCSDKDAYRFYNWSGVDGFIYFSHSFITVPPIGWIQAAHRHNTKVYGTLITEWDEGEEICTTFLKDDVTTTNTINQLVKLAKLYKFEGWLINIENQLNSEQVLQMVKFLKCLTQTMHENINDSEVIWYDSVTNEGKLVWQNKLNDLNKCFFDVSDGIFLNYTWTVDDLAKSRENAKERYLDIYVGLDVFGRNFHGGGGFNTHAALQLVREHGLSAAIFAQAWTYECLEVQNFVSNENKLWKTFVPYLHYNGPCKLPFRTYLCQGFGDRLYKNGEVLKKSPWHNLFDQQYQPLWCEGNDEINMTITTEDSFTGGSCLSLHSLCGGSLRLFVCKLDWKIGLLITMTYKWLSPPSELLLFLDTKCDDSKDRKQINVHFERHPTNSEAQFNDSGTSLSTPAVVNEEKNGWITKLYHLTGKGSTVQAITLNLKSSAKLLIGQICLQNQCIKGHPTSLNNS